MKKWIVAFAAAAVLGLLSMGALGAALYFLAYPVLGPFHGSLNDWRGDWVWPTTILAGMLWAFGFLIVGAVERLAPLRSAFARWGRFLVVLWAWAVIVWAVLLFFA
jgi:hypothetical protein